MRPNVAVLGRDCHFQSWSAILLFSLQVVIIHSAKHRYPNAGPPAAHGHQSKLTASTDIVTKYGDRGRVSRYCGYRNILRRAESNKTRIYNRCHHSAFPALLAPCQSSIQVYDTSTASVPSSSFMLSKRKDWMPLGGIRIPTRCPKERIGDGMIHRTTRVLSPPLP